MSALLRDDRIKFAFGRAVLQPDGVAELDRLPLVVLRQGLGLATGL